MRKERESGGQRGTENGTCECPGCVGHGAKNLLSLVDLFVFARLCAFTDTYSGLGSAAWYPWQPQWNLVKDVMSMLFRKTDRLEVGSRPGL